jgi:hypothetical protein
VPDTFYKRHKFVSDIGAAYCRYCGVIRMLADKPCRSDPASVEHNGKLHRSIGVQRGGYGDYQRRD